MRISVKLSVIAFGTLCLGGVASANDHNNRGTPPDGVIRWDIQRHANSDGRASTVDASARPFQVQFAPERNNDRHDYGFARPTIDLPIKADITNRLALKSGEQDDPKPLTDESHATSIETTRTNGGVLVNPFAAKHGPPIALKSDIALKLSGGGEEGAGQAAKIKIDALRSDEASRNRVRFSNPASGAIPGMKFQYASRIGGNSGGGDITDEK